MRPFGSSRLSNLIHAFRWQCILVCGCHRRSVLLGICARKRKAILATHTTRLLTVSNTPSVPYCTIHSVALPLYPTRYLSHPFGTNDFTAVLTQAPFVLYIHALPAHFVLRLHLDFSPSQRSRDRLSLLDLHRYYPSSLICPFCCCCHQRPLISTTILIYFIFTACCIDLELAHCLPFIFWVSYSCVDSNLCITTVYPLG